MLKIIMQGSIRKRLVVILIAASIPAIAILLTNGLMNRNRSIEKSSNELLQFARQLATIQENTTLTTKVLLEQLARRPEVLQTDVPACQELFASMVERYPFLFGVHLVNSEGDLVASSRPLVVANFKKTKHFQAAIETEKFVPGEYLVGILRPVPIFPFAQPVLDEHGEVQGVLLTALHLGGSIQQFNRMRFPKDSFVGICDRNGIRLFRYPEMSAGTIGEPIRSPMFEAARSAAQGGIKSDIGTDGVERIIAFTPVRLDPDSVPYMYIFVGSPEAIVHANAQKGMVRDMLLFILTLALALGLGWGVGGRSLKRKLEELAVISKQIGEGDYSVRIAEDSDVNEVLAFSTAFNRMTKALEEDFSERKRVEDALRESEARFRNLFDLIPAVAVQGYSMDGTTRFWNKASEFFYGYSTDEALGKNLVDLIIPEEMRPIVVQEMNAMAKTGKPIPPSELYLKRKDGSCIQVFSSHAVIERHNQPPEFFCIDIDLTQLKQTEEALIKAKQAAEASNRAKSEFLANMSHEIRTPLNGITGMLQVLKTTGLQGEQVEFTDTALQSCRRLTTLLTDILDLSRIEAGKMAIVAAPLRLSEIVTQLQDLFSPSIKESGVALNFHIAPDIPAQLVGDATRLQQVLTNLLGNALKFTSVGSVTVEAYPLPPRRTGEYRVLFCVADTGIGIPDDKLSELFRPFAQVCEGFRRQYQGAGLGLSICKRLVDLMGGNMAVESQLGIGTSVYFCVTLGLEPVAVDVRDETNVSMAGSQVPALAGLHVLVAEDDQVSGLLAMKLLTKAGATVKIVEDGEQALAALRQEHFDLILMDIQMPVVGGVDATRAIRNGEAGNDKKDIPIIALTAYAMVGDREKFLAAGMNGYLAKPVETETLLEVVEEAMHRAEGRA